MTIKQTFTWMLTAATLSSALVVSFVFFGASPQPKIKLEHPPAMVMRTDELVRPAAAEVDLNASPLKAKVHGRVRTAIYETASNPNQHDGLIRDAQVQLCQGVDCGCSGGCSTCGGVGTAAYAAPMVQQSYVQPTVAYAQTAQPSFGYAQPPVESMPGRAMCAVDGNSRGNFSAEPRWGNARPQNWEQYSYGEYIGPFRTPHVPDYRIRIGDQLEFVYLLTRQRTNEPYRIYVGDTIQVTSTTDSTLNQPSVQILSDGTISLPLIGTVRTAGKTINNLQRELNDRYTEFVKTPEIVVQVIQGDTPLNDLRDAVDARAGQGGQSRNAQVSPDGTVQLPKIGSVPAIGLTLEEISREINARYRLFYSGIEVTPILTERAPRFIYVIGEVGQSGQFPLTGPTTVMQALALAQGFGDGGNMRQVIVFRRDANWQLIATKLDLNGALNGRRPYPSDEIWLRDSDIVLVPKKPIQRLSEAVNQYLTTTIYGIFPQQGIQFNFDGFQSL
ncbi:polysaccharide biosynthesis/export family protein [Mariniblastus fucicola]|uniref:Polysaccharide biosynthesis/export protein n=1 Tax=Mariniblastus fucicola TaxID=980251 RepID=A0A5B9PJ75_9BACT|nr:polysaccharide biosynthesis/export family protein [Mariniblastus fucicola]QEG24732.1 Polysaccharide biosynthesis/export protein [Mariniblastus fucicola]